MQLLKNAWVHDGLGNTQKADILLDDGRIVQVAPTIEGEGEDLTGKHITPGLIQTISNWGVNGSMTEIRPSSSDNDEHSNPITPELDGFYAFNGRAVTAQQLGAFGLTSFGVAPTDNNLFGGTIAAFVADGVNPYKMCLNRNIALIASVDKHVKNTYGKNKKAPMTSMWIFTNLAEQLRKADAYKEEADKPRDEKLAAIKRAVEGEMPLFVCCGSGLAAERVREIVAAYPKVKLALVNGFGLTGDEDWIVEQNVPVIVRTAANPKDEEAMTLDLKGIARLMEKGATVALSGSYANAFGAREDLLWNAAEMMRVLHDGDKVLPMITSIPARLLGLENVTGSIQPGLRADLVIWSDDPMKSWQAKVVRTLMGGEVIYKEGDALKCM